MFHCLTATSAPVSTPSRESMKKPLINLLTTFCIFTLLVQATEGHAASLRTIRKLYRQKEYKRAKAALRDEMEHLKGNSYYEALLLLAKLETSIAHTGEDFVQTRHLRVLTVVLLRI